MRRIINLLSVSAIPVLLFMQLTSCIDEKREHDAIYISKANGFITKNDISVGIKKTLNTMPLVIFSHDSHEKKGVDCFQCHHKKNNDSRIKKCVACHKGIQGTESLHSYCIGCHEKKKDGPVVCAECHIEEKKEYVSQEMKKQYNADGIYKDPFHPVHEKNKIECVTCHHKEKLGSSKMRKCSECHTGEPKLRIIHIFCKDCHDNTKTAPISCKGCHK